MLRKHFLFLILLSGSVSDSSLTPSLPTSLHTNPATALSQEQKKIKVEGTHNAPGTSGPPVSWLNSQESGRGKGLGGAGQRSCELCRCE